MPSSEAVSVSQPMAAQLPSRARRRKRRAAPGLAAGLAAAGLAGAGAGAFGGAGVGVTAVSGGLGVASDIELSAGLLPMVVGRTLTHGYSCSRRCALVNCFPVAAGETRPRLRPPRQGLRPANACRGRVSP